ncbi:MAG: carboxypeptidase regulatory-like domain-containing protein, partial [Holophagales bacterium]|nr:carboxypeptidase regulatory-like domain-containing protein [Holophagales bacterium]
RLPLLSLEVPSARLEVEVWTPRKRPKIRENPLGELIRFDGRNEAEGSGAEKDTLFRARGEARNLRAEEDFELTLRVADPIAVVSDAVSPAGTTAFALADADPPRGSASFSPPRRVAVLWDASWSRARADHRKALRVLRAVLEDWRPEAVSLTVLRERAIAAGTFDLRWGGLDPLVSTLEALHYDGATAWHDLPLPAGFEADAALLVSDGRITLGPRRLPDLGVPLYVLASSTSTADPMLRHMATRSGGRYGDLATSTAEEVRERWRRDPMALRRVDVVSGDVREIRAPFGEPVNETIFVSGKLLTPTAELRLVYATAGGRPDERTDAGSAEERRVHVRSAAFSSGLVARFEAQQRLAELALDPEEHREQLLTLGRAHGLVTPATSLLVLESIDQYLRYEIEPPASLPEMRLEYREWQAEAHDESKEMRGDHRRRLERSWERYIRWREGEDRPKGRGPRVRDSRGEAAGGGRHARNRARSGAPPEDPLAGRTAAPRSLRGVVRDFEGLPLPGVTVRLESPALASTRTVVTDAEGVYSARTLPPGPYEVRFELEGFSTVEGEARISGDDSARLDVELPLSAVTEELLVVTSVASHLPAEADGVRIELRPWTPEAAYLEALSGLPNERLYAAYLEARRSHGQSPAFFLDLARLLIGRGLREEGLRVATNLLELETGAPRLTRVTANLMLEAGALDLAVQLFDRLERERPELPQSRRDLALALLFRGKATQERDPAAARADFQRAADLLLGVALEPWGAVSTPLQIAYDDEDRFGDIGRIALVEYNWALARLAALEADAPPVTSAAGAPARENPADGTEPPWSAPIDADLRIVLTWDDAYADMDLWVIEPSGEKVFYDNPRSRKGGLLSRDCVSGLGPESYLVRTATPGTYRILVDFFDDSGPELLGPVTVQTLITTHLGRPGEQVELRR